MLQALGTMWRPCYAMGVKLGVICDHFRSSSRLPGIVLEPCWVFKILTVLNNQQLIRDSSKREPGYLEARVSI